MCRQHLLGEHRELHALVGSLIKGKSISHYAQLGLSETHNLEVRHTQLVTEMLERGYHHGSFWPENIVLPTEGKVDVWVSITELYKRCENCRVRIYNSEWKPKIDEWIAS